MSEERLSGSCLCGSVAFEIHCDARRFYHCHCERCRKSTGSAHASNIIAKPISVSWSAGEELVRHYRLPEAKYYGAAFCSNCGSPVPRVAPDRSYAVIPAGTLDHEPRIEPEARIFHGSRAEWSCDQRAIPVHDEYPPRN